jgi:hypothetical protein
MPGKRMKMAVQHLAPSIVDKKRPAGFSASKAAKPGGIKFLAEFISLQFGYQLWHCPDQSVQTSFDHSVYPAILGIPSYSGVRAYTVNWLPLCVSITDFPSCAVIYLSAIKKSDHNGTLIQSVLAAFVNQRGGIWSGIRNLLVRQ